MNEIVEKDEVDNSLGHLPARVSSIEEGRPLVSIGLPVYNGENYIEDAIDSVLSQTFTRFELIICDNASDDATAEICEKAARADDRVHYFRNLTNIGLAGNFNRTVGLASGKYFMWLAHDDMLLPEFLESCVAELESDAELAMVYPESEVIDGAGQLLEPGQFMDGLTDFSKSTRFESNLASETDRWRDALKQLWTGNGLLTLQYGLIRKEYLARTQLFGRYPSSDSVFLAELALLGKFKELPRVLYRRRVHADRMSQRYDDVVGRAIVMSGGSRSTQVLLHWRYLYEYLKILGRHDMRIRKKAVCLWPIARFYVRSKYKSMMGDFVRAGAWLLNGDKRVA